MRLAFVLSILIIPTISSAGPTSFTPAPELYDIDKFSADDPPIKVVEAPQQDYLADHYKTARSVSNIIFIDFCEGGCDIKPGNNDARNDVSSIVCAGNTVTMPENNWTPTERQQLIECIEDVWAPYDVQLVYTKPDNQTLYHRSVITGSYSTLGCNGNALGIAPVFGGCSFLDNAISYTFTHDISGANKIEFACAAQAQEAAHSFGLYNHVNDYQDPMTYLSFFRGRRYFRNRNMPCGESFFEPFENRPCDCTGAGQNSHVILNTNFGVGDPIEDGTTTIAVPGDGESVNDGFPVYAFAEHKRSIERVELYINDWKYQEMSGKEWPNWDDSYQFSAQTLPDGVQNIEVRAYHDIGLSATASVTVTKGVPCTSNEQCFDGQECRADGGCYWPTPVAEIGDTCVRDQDCVSLTCSQVDEEKLCSKSCFAGVANACPADFEFLTGGGTNGVCWPVTSSGGCCQTDDGTIPLLPVMILLVGLATLRVIQRKSESL